MNRRAAGSSSKRGFLFTKDNDAHAAKGMVCVDCHKTKRPPDADRLRPEQLGQRRRAALLRRLVTATARTRMPTITATRRGSPARPATSPRTGGAFAKDFTIWATGTDKFYEPTTLKKEANETTPVYAWYNGTVENIPHFIGPKGSKDDNQEQDIPVSRSTRVRHTTTSRPGSCSPWISPHRWRPAIPWPV